LVVAFWDKDVVVWWGVQVLFALERMFLVDLQKVL